MPVMQNRDIIGAFTKAETFGNQRSFNGNNGAVNYSNKRAKVWSLGEGGNRPESGGFSHGNLTGLFHKSDRHIHCIRYTYYRTCHYKSKASLAISLLNNLRSILLSQQPAFLATKLCSKQPLCQPHQQPVSKSDLAPLATAFLSNSYPQKLSCLATAFISNQSP